MKIIINNRTKDKTDSYCTMYVAALLDDKECMNCFNDTIPINDIVVTNEKCGLACLVRKTKTGYSFAIEDLKIKEKTNE